MKRLEELLNFVRETDLQEVLWEKDGTRISFKRADVQPLPRANATPPAESPAPESKPVEPSYIRSPMVGTFYRSESADRPPMVIEGTVVVSGQPVAGIEAMKIMKDVVAPMPCRIVRALVVNGHSVEYGQPLFEVEPENGHV